MSSSEPSRRWPLRPLRSQFPQLAWLDYAAPAISLPCLLATLAPAVAEPAAVDIATLRLAAALSVLALLTLIVLLVQLRWAAAGPEAPASGVAAVSQPPGRRLLRLIGLMPVFFAILALLVLICAHLAAVITLYALEEPLIASPFGGRPAYRELLWFWLDKTLKGALFDVMEVFSLSVATVDWNARANVAFAWVVVVWRMFISVVVVAVLLAAPRAIWRAIRAAAAGVIARA